MANLQSTSFTDLTLPAGPTADRVASPTAGMTRYNTNVGTVEFYDGTAWRPVTGISKGTIGSGGQSIMYVGANGSRTSGGIVHMFTNTGSQSFTPAFTGTVEILVVAGGGSGGAHWGGGGGGGGTIYQRAYPVTNGTPISVTVGAGGTKAVYPNAGNQGGPSSFGSITSTGGGAGGSWYNQGGSGNMGGTTGGSGGGAAMVDSPDSRYRTQGFAGIQGQGFPGGSGVRYNQQGDNCHMAGGGGGSGGVGKPGPDNAYDGRVADGGPGAANDIIGGILYWGGGGAGCCYQGNGELANAGGIGGGGGSGFYHGGPRHPGGPFSNGMGGGMALNQGQPGQSTDYSGNGGTNTGGGGGGANYNHGGSGTGGGTGIVIIRY